MYIEASNMLPGHSARLVTPELRGSFRPQCVTFYYHMYGTGTGVLNVLLRQKGKVKETLLWSRQGEQSISWMKATVDYDCFTKHNVRAWGTFTHTDTHTHWLSTDPEVIGPAITWDIKVVRIVRRRKYFGLTHGVLNIENETSRCSLDHVRHQCG